MNLHESKNNSVLKIFLLAFLFSVFNVKFGSANAFCQKGDSDDDDSENGDDIDSQTQLQLQTQFQVQTQKLEEIMHSFQSLSNTIDIKHLSFDNFQNSLQLAKQFKEKLTSIDDKQFLQSSLPQWSLIKEGFSNAVLNFINTMTCDDFKNEQWNLMNQQLNPDRKHSHTFSLILDLVEIMLLTNIWNEQVIINMCDIYRTLWFKMVKRTDQMPITPKYVSMSDNDIDRIGLWFCDILWNNITNNILLKSNLTPIVMEKLLDVSLHMFTAPLITLKKQGFPEFEENNIKIRIEMMEILTQMLKEQNAFSDNIERKMSAIIDRIVGNDIILSQRWLKAKFETEWSRLYQQIHQI